MPFEVRTRVFEGPLDLLLQLIMSHELSITEISLTDVVNEYIAFIDEMADLDLDVTSEFLLIAATLMQIKVNHLLPEDSSFDLDDELALSEERDRLLSRLLACLTFKDVAAVLRHRMEAAEKYMPRRAGLPEDLDIASPDVRLGVDLQGFLHVAEMVFTTPDLDPNVDHLDLELPSVQDAMIDLQGRLSIVATSEFDEVVAHCTRDIEVIAYFLALLELARWGIVRVSQAEPSDPIALAYDHEAADNRFQAMLGTQGDT